MCAVSVLEDGFVYPRSGQDRRQPMVFIDSEERQFTALVLFFFFFCLQHISQKLTLGPRRQDLSGLVVP